MKGSHVIAVSSEDRAFEDPFPGKRYVRLFPFHAPAATERRIAVLRVT